MSNQQIANKLHKTIIRIFKRRMVYSSFNGNIWGADVADMQLISKENKGIKCFLSSIGLFSKCAWVSPLKGKKGVGIVNEFKTILDSSKGKPNKIRIDQGSEFYNKAFKKFLKENHIEMYSTFKEGKYLATERFIRTLTHDSCFKKCLF